MMRKSELILGSLCLLGPSQISGMINGGFQGLVGSLGGRHPSALSPVPPRARGWDPIIQDSSYFSYLKCQEVPAIVSPAPFKSTLQPLCFSYPSHFLPSWGLNTCSFCLASFSQLLTFRTLLHRRGASPNCFPLSYHPGSPSERQPHLSLAH